MIDAVCFDLDSTLADTSHRQSMIPAIEAGEKTWDDYSMACPDDKPIESTIWLANLCYATNHAVFIVTGRSAAAKELTVQWLKDNHVFYTNIIMRPAGDRTPNSVFKIQVLQILKNAGYNVQLFVEDFPLVAEQIEKHHPEIPVLLVNPGAHAPSVAGA